MRRRANPLIVFWLSYVQCLSLICFQLSLCLVLDIYYQALDQKKKEEKKRGRGCDQLSISFSPFNCCLSVVLQLDEGNYPPKSYVVFCPNKQHYLNLLCAWVLYLNNVGRFKATYHRFLLVCLFYCVLFSDGHRWYRCKCISLLVTQTRFFCLLYGQQLIFPLVVYLLTHVGKPSHKLFTLLSPLMRQLENKKYQLRRCFIAVSYTHLTLPTRR